MSGFNPLTVVMNSIAIDATCRVLTVAIEADEGRNAVMLLVLIILILLLGGGGAYRARGAGIYDPLGLVLFILLIFVVLSLFPVPWHYQWYGP